MAKDKRPINVQVAELTAEQRRNIPRIMLFHTLSVVLILVLVIALTGIPAFEAQSDYRDAVDDYGDAIDAWTDYGDMLENVVGNNYVFDDHYQALKDKVDEAEEEVDEAKKEIVSKFLVFIIVMGSVLVIDVIVAAVIYKKYPYYSDGKCFYILCHRKELG